MQSAIICNLTDGMSVVTARVAKAYCQVVSCYIALQLNYGGRAVDVRLGGLSPQCQDTNSNAILGLGLIKAFFRGNVSIWRTYTRQV